MWNKLTQKQFSYESYYQSAHHIMAKPKLWMHCLWQLPKGFKDSAISQGNQSPKLLIEDIFTCFFLRWSSQSFWEKMSPKLRSTSRTSTLRPNLYPTILHHSYYTILHYTLVHPTIPYYTFLIPHYIRPVMRAAPLSTCHCYITVYNVLQFLLPQFYNCLLPHFTQFYNCLLPQFTQFPTLHNSHPPRRKVEANPCVVHLGFTLYYPGVYTTLFIGLHYTIHRFTLYCPEVYPPLHPGV